MHSPSNHSNATFAAPAVRWDFSTDNPLFLIALFLLAMECTDLVLLIEGSEFAFKNCVSLRCIQGHVNYMILDAPKTNAPLLKVNSEPSIKMTRKLPTATMTADAIGPALQPSKGLASTWKDLWRSGETLMVAGLEGFWWHVSRIQRMSFYTVTTLQLVKTI